MRSGKDEQREEWFQDFEAARSRSLKERWDYSFIHTYKPILDDAPYRVFSSLEDYRKWCEKNLPAWLGYGQKL